MISDNILCGEDNLYVQFQHSKELDDYFKQHGRDNMRI